MRLRDVETEADWKQMYKERGEKIRQVLQEKRQNGEATGMPAVGYRTVVGPNGKKRVEEDPVMGPLVREARELHATGKYSFRQLLTIMTAKGLRSRNGKVLGPSALLYILKGKC